MEKPRFACNRKLRRKVWIFFKRTGSRDRIQIFFRTKIGSLADPVGLSKNLYWFLDF
jgi:hypothetical protein